MTSVLSTHVEEQMSSSIPDVEVPSVGSTGTVSIPPFEVTMATRLTVSSQNSSGALFTLTP